MCMHMHMHQHYGYPSHVHGPSSHSPQFGSGMGRGGTNGAGRGAWPGGGIGGGEFLEKQGVVKWGAWARCGHSYIMQL